MLVQLSKHSAVSECVIFPISSHFFHFPSWLLRLIPSLVFTGPPLPEHQPVPRRHLITSSHGQFLFSFTCRNCTVVRRSIRTCPLKASFSSILRFSCLLCSRAFFWQEFCPCTSSREFSELVTLNALSWLSFTDAAYCGHEECVSLLLKVPGIDFRAHNQREQTNYAVTVYLTSTQTPLYCALGLLA